MNKIRNDFPPDLKKFFYELQDYLDEDLYFYGSVNRSDYVHGKSDIDIAIFTDNENSIMSKLQHYLHAPKKAFDKIVRKIEGTMIYGYKIKCEKYIDSKCEISIYNNFQRYNNEPQNINPILNKNIEGNTKTPEESINELVDVSTYVRNN